MRRLRSHRREEYGIIDIHGRTTNLNELITLLNSKHGLRVFKYAFHENMTYKVRKYTELLEVSNIEVQKSLDVVNVKIPQLKRAARIERDDRSDNWHIFESVSGPYRTAKHMASQFEVLLNRATERLSGTMAQPYLVEPRDPFVENLRDEFVNALDRLSNFSSQSHIVTKVVDMVSSFLKDPRLFRHKMMNFMMMGGAGTGKTTLAEAIGDVFAKAGMFVGNQLIQAGRAELVGQYMGAV